MPYKVGTLFIRNWNINRIDIDLIKRIEAVLENGKYYKVSYLFNKINRHQYTYSMRELEYEHILTEEDIKLLNKILTFQ